MTAPTVLFAGGGTGGHLYPGLAIARALRQLRPDVQPHFVGAERGIERDVLPTTEFPFTLLDLHPLYRPRVWQNWRTARGVMRSWGRLQRVGRSHAPALVVGTGGYASGLTLAWAAWRGIPVVQHMGDAIPGITARWSARFTREIYLGYPEARRALPATRALMLDTGNPIDPPPDIRPDATAARAQWGFPAAARVLLVFGGSQGARAINQAMAAWVSAGLPRDLCVIWATGKGQYDAYRSLDRPDVRVVPYLAPIATAYAAADLALVRAGMMGSSELCAWGIPMVLVPLPTAAADHQTANARVLEAAGAGVHLPQAQLSATALAETVTGLLSNAPRLAAMARAAESRGKPQAAAEIAARVAALLATTG
ncbi:MAG: UDP-N-acetylglucosamine--N-acetylmuramyl-(pentapeptide) pyrophosphoryl-undecaprenol N-acetylglucosamine transferase [Gemmatimonadaceae bacterium]|nr:UDP-N-acetylglucosamine--N-acetylmuramyl-(pentapeptide) pyrophosphoryl-undecaprenol N-acetylglucosamine transferase [Gemmatimonadaceae bacterium]